jgi:hypothetical protein
MSKILSTVCKRNHVEKLGVEVGLEIVGVLLPTRRLLSANTLVLWREMSSLIVPAVHTRRQVRVQRDPR